MNPHLARTIKRIIKKADLNKVEANYVQGEIIELAQHIMNEMSKPDGDLRGCKYDCENCIANIDLPPCDSATEDRTKTRYSIQEARVSFTVVIVEYPFKHISTTYPRRKVYGFKSAKEAQAYIDKQTSKI